MATPANVDAPARVPVDATDWASLIDAAGLKGPVGQLAQHASLIAVEQNVIRLALKPAHEHFNAPPLVLVMEEKLGSVLGRAIKVRFEKPSAERLPEAPAEIAGRERSARQQATEQSMNDDPVVQALMRDFDARLIPDSIRPNK
jgi:DNA polymerase-3 subunit gamma/tau